MANIFFLKNNKKFKKEMLPLLIEKYQLQSVPFGKIGTVYSGEGISIIIDQTDVRIHILKKGLVEDVENLLEIKF